MKVATVQVARRSHMSQGTALGLVPMATQFGFAAGRLVRVPLLRPAANTGAWLGRYRFSEPFAGASSAAAKNRRRRAPSAGAGGYAERECSRVWRVVGRRRALS